MAIVSSDIYEMSNFLNELKKQNIGASDDTLAMGIFGYLTDCFSHLTQNNIIVASEYINEMFPTRVKYEKNILDHAMLYNITDINAVPATIDIALCLIETDVLNNMNNNNEIYIDRKCPIYIGDFEFHLEYDIIIHKSILNNSKTFYTARYNYSDSSHPNPISNLTNPYLAAPYVQKIGNNNYIFVKCMMRQITYKDIYKKVITDNYIANKTFEFEFDDQLAAFDMKITDGDTTFFIDPLLQGSSSAGYGNDSKFCYYKYIDSHNVRILFENKSYIPTLNTDITITNITTRGLQGNFEYIDDIITSMTSETYGYTDLSVMIRPLGNSQYGADRTSIDELKEIIPREALSRGSITTITDLENYFNTISDRNNKLTFVKKADNQLERLYHSYLLLKDDNDRILPSNTINLQLLYYNNEQRFDGVREEEESDSDAIIRIVGESTPMINDILVIKTLNEANGYTKIVYKYDGTDWNVMADHVDNDFDSGSDSRYIIKPGTKFELFNEGSDNWIGRKYYTDEYDDNNIFIYSLPFLVIVNIRPTLYTSYYLNIIDKIYELTIDGNNINSNSDLQFIAWNGDWKRQYNVNRDVYKFTFQCSQNINEDREMVILDDNGEVVSSKLRAIALLTGTDGSYFKEANSIRVADATNFIYEFDFSFTTSDLIDDNNNINILDVQRGDSQRVSETVEAFFPRNTSMKIYILYEDESSHGTMGLENYIPNDYIRPITNHTVSNIYEISGGVEFFFNYTDIISSNATVTQELLEEGSGRYKQYVMLRSVPCLRASYVEDESNVLNLVDIIETKRGYIENALNVLEDQFGIDFKFYNTYGPSRTFRIDNNFLDRVNIDLRFEVALKPNADRSNLMLIINDIKTLIENLNNTDSDIHMSNIVTQITNKYLTDTLNYIEFVSINEYPTNKQFLSRINGENLEVDCPPEFINIHYRKNDITGEDDMSITLDVVG